MQQGPTYRGCNPHTGFPVKSSETQNRPRVIEIGPTPKRGSDVLWLTHTGFPVNDIVISPENGRQSVGPVNDSDEASL